MKCEGGGGSELDNQEMINLMTCLSIFSCLSIVQFDDMFVNFFVFVNCSIP